MFDGRKQRDSRGSTPPEEQDKADSGDDQDDDEGESEHDDEGESGLDVSELPAH
jgi:hypothetical protein